LDAVEKIREELRESFARDEGLILPIRIPKTASASFARALFNWKVRQVFSWRRIKDDEEAHGTDWVEYEAPAGWWDHYSAQFCIDTLGAEAWGNALTMAVVRNPWQRLYSIWKYWHCTAVTAAVDSKVLQFAEISFSDWIMGGCKETAWTAPHHSVVFPANPVLSQLSWVTTQSDDIAVKVLLRLEELVPHGERVLRQQLGPGFRMGVERLNATSVENEYQSYYTPQLIEKVNELCREDIELFGYTFDGIINNTYTQEMEKQDE